MNDITRANNKSEIDDWNLEEAWHDRYYSFHGFRKDWKDRNT